MIEPGLYFFILLMGSGSLSAWPAWFRVLPHALAVTVGLHLLPESWISVVPFQLIAGLIGPLFLWQFMQRASISNWRWQWNKFFLWFVLAVCIAVLLLLIRPGAWIEAFIYGIVAASFLSALISQPGSGFPFHLLGTLLLILIITEPPASLQSFRIYLSNLASGASLGWAIAVLFRWIRKKFSIQWEGWLVLAVLYLSYGVAFVFQASAVAAMLVVITLIKPRFSEGLDPSPEPKFSTVNKNSYLSIVWLTLFFFLGSRVLLPLSMEGARSISVGLISGMLVILAGRLLAVRKIDRLSNLLFGPGLLAGCFLSILSLSWLSHPLQEPWYGILGFITLPLLFGLAHLMERVHTDVSKVFGS